MLQVNQCSVREAVSIYHGNGLRVMPIHGVDEGCKHLVTKCEGQCYGKVPSEEHWPDKTQFSPMEFKDNSNLAMVMGRQLDGRWLVGLDIDGDLDLNEWFSLPDTMECKTRRGTHLVFEVPPDTALGNWNDILNTRSKTQGYKWGYHGALDIKYCRGAMVSPPSKTSSGENYQWIRFMRPAYLPDEIISLLKWKRKCAFPDVKRYTRWSLNPSHMGKNP